MSGDRRADRRSLRWRDHDYAGTGTYFVTICTQGRDLLFGEVLNGEMRLNACGEIVEEEWMRTGVIRPEVEIDIFAVMPNHLHGLVTILQPVGAHGGAPEHSGDGELKRNARLPGRADRRLPLRAPRSLGSLIAGFKQSTTVRINALRGTPGARVWQRGFFDRVVRDDGEFDRIACYIVTNPERWNRDGNHP